MTDEYTFPNSLIFKGKDNCTKIVFDKTNPGTVTGNFENVFRNNWSIPVLLIQFEGKML